MSCTKLLLIIATLLLTTVAMGDEQGEACIEGEGKTGVSACQSLAGKLSADLPRLKTLARRLEEDRRFDAALAVYGTARKYYPSDRSSLQGFIRNRSAARQLQEETSTPPVQTDIATVENIKKSLCWTATSDAAVADCRGRLVEAENPSATLERIGDILRSQGRVVESLQAYKNAISADAADEALGVKHDALRSLVQDRAIAETPSPPVGTTGSGVVAQLELLEDLRSREFVDAAEYERRRAQILDNALVSSAPASAAAVRPPTPLQVDKVDRRSFGRYRALIIANEKYRNQQRLRTPLNDAEAIGQLLREGYGFEVTTLKNADRYEMAKALSDLRKDTRPDDNVLVYFAGHGYLDEVTRRGYWLPVDADADSYANWISTSDVTDTLAAIPARHAIVIADSCFSGSLLRSGVGLADTLRRLKSKRSRTVITSGGMEPVSDSSSSFGSRKHSVFANALLSALRTNDKPIEAGRLFLEVRDVVSNNAEQTPQHAPIRNAGHEGGDFIFLPL